MDITVIEGALKKIEQGHVSGYLATDAQGNPVSPMSSTAAKWCIQGAIMAAGYDGWNTDIYDAIAAEMSEQEVANLANFSAKELNVYVANSNTPEKWDTISKVIGFNNVRGQGPTVDLLRRTLNAQTVTD